MLPQAYPMMKLTPVLAALSLALAGAASAQMVSEPPPKAGASVKRAPTADATAQALQAAQDAASSAAPKDGKLPYVPYGNLEKASAEDIKAAKDSAAAMVRDILHSYETRQTEEMKDTAQQLGRRADDIADAAIAAERDKVLEFLGIDPSADTSLYYFVSWSMPLEMLRSYAIEAMWTGGTLVIKGVPPGKELGKFLVDDLRQLVYGKGAAANISIDPRLFDAYAVKAVPTIVFTTVRDNMQCQGVNPVPVKVDNIETSYDTCPELDPGKYWKLSGAVTTSYALQTFIDDGATKAEPYLKALARGWAGQEAPGKEQRPFVGEWKDVLSPAEQAAALEAAKSLGSALPKN